MAGISPIHPQRITPGREGQVGHAPTNPRKQGIKLQDDLEALQHNNIDKNISNPQRLWNEFKSDIRTMARKMREVFKYKMETHVGLLQKDLKAIMSNLAIDSNNDLRWNGNLIANVIKHLEKKRAQSQKNIFSANLAKHGEKPGGIWSAISK